jgi:acetoin:2,6-dichlorophenolindophenol oxidoreductase subunit beta
MRIITFRDALNETLRQEMRRDPDVFHIGESLAGGAGIPEFENADGMGGSLGATRGLVAEFSRRRIMDTPISESAFIGAALGASMLGLRPIVELQYASFFGVAGDQIFNQIGKTRFLSGGKADVHLVIRAPNGGGYGAAAHHSDMIYSMVTHMPGWKTVAPSTPYDLKGLLASSIRGTDPVFFFEHVMLFDTKGPVPEEEYTIPLGKADIKKEGSDVTIVAVQRMNLIALRAAESLAKDGINVEVIDPRSLSPLDEDTIVGSVQKTRKLVVVDEDQPRCSFATDIAAMVAEKCFDYLEAPIKRITPPHASVPFSPPEESFYIPSAERVAEAVRSMV